MPAFRRQFLVQAPLAVVVDFHRDPSALRLLTPPPIFVQLHRVEPLAEGSQVEFTLWMGPVPVRWLAQHQDVGAEGFSDVQQRGPFQHWMHRHTFRAVSDNQTEVSDEVMAEFGQGLFAGLISRLMWLGLPVLFAYRSWVTRRLCQKEIQR